MHNKSNQKMFLRGTVITYQHTHKSTVETVTEYHDFKDQKHEVTGRDHSFPRQIFPNSAGQFAKFRGPPIFHI